MQAQTSLEAYANKKPSIPTDHNLILSVMDTNKDFTYKELWQRIIRKLSSSQYISVRKQAEGWKYDPNRVSRRTKELVSMKKASIKGRRKCTIADSNCTTYVKI